MNADKSVVLLVHMGKNHINTKVVLFFSQYQISFNILLRMEAIKNITEAFCHLFVPQKIVYNEFANEVN